MLHSTDRVLFSMLPSQVNALPYAKQVCPWKSWLRTQVCNHVAIGCVIYWLQTRVRNHAPLQCVSFWLQTWVRHRAPPTCVFCWLRTRVRNL